MLTVLRDACDAMLAVDDAFWITAAITGWSFETAESQGFRRSIRSFADAGLPIETVKRLERGVNENLVALLADHSPHLLPIHSNKGHSRRRPDIRFGATETADEVIAEVKVVHDLTIPVYYGNKEKTGIADDRDKLRAHRDQGFLGQLYQIVFFVQLPRFDYPTGCWYEPEWKHSPRCRHLEPGIRGIEAQYRHLCNFLTEPPVWPTNDPEIRPLAASDPEVTACMCRRFTSIFRPDGKWAFSPEAHLAEAAVGYAIWRY